ncbi:MAG: outer membrane protein assembly factor BamD, partial [Rhodocyclaceae bacterium]|nr:outer membrane protein assembly factor BamD [Rhodocyclaceae bacterium]
SRYAEDASQRMQYLVNSLSAYEVHVARYYLKRGAYLASANRAQTAISTYPETPATEEALYILTQAYDALGMTELRDDAQRVLAQSFPQSAYLTGDAERGSAWWKLW